MLKVRQVKIEVLSDNENKRKKALSKKLGIREEEIVSYKITKQSLDARDKNNILYVYEFNVVINNEEDYLKRNKCNDIVLSLDDKYIFEKSGKTTLNNPIVIVGAGPAGLFCAYTLAENGYKPIIIERGKPVEQRIGDIQKFWEEGLLNPESNVQFGEGGAGTFSDGKLNTLVKDSNNRMKKVFETFVECGANEDILYSYKPHVGTDVLRQVIVNMRNKIIEMGGKFLYENCLTNIFLEGNHISAIEVNNQDQILCDALVLAIGHSARDTFKMLSDNKFEMISKPFAVGLRVQHLQEMINTSQYGEKYADKLGTASYKLTYKASSGRGVYSFCMCPGGFVVNASSETGLLAINGMSNHARDENNANSAIVVTVDPKDYGESALGGIEFQRNLEKRAYELGKGHVPIQLLGDYNSNTVSKEFKSISPVMKGKYTFANLNELFNEDINRSLKEAFEHFGSKINGFNNPDAILAGVESRTSSPVKIVRNENFESNYKGIFPCGEGAGYAGGITSAGIDGIKVAEAIGKIFK
ncbi:MAG: FAD-dependent oxidoreductase [Bacilli bacterium]|nr:FAD-dependent oxidoreductase [Bacilli bacterium]